MAEEKWESTRVEKLGRIMVVGRVSQRTKRWWSESRFRH